MIVLIILAIKIYSGLKISGINVTLITSMLAIHKEK